MIKRSNARHADEYQHHRMIRGDRGSRDPTDRAGRRTRSGESGAWRQRCPARTRTDRHGPIQEAHLPEPGLLVLDAAGLDDDTVYAFQNAIAQTWAATVDGTTRDAGQPGVRLRMYIDLRQVLAQTLSPERALDGDTQEAWSATTGGAADQA